MSYFVSFSLFVLEKKLYTQGLELLKVFCSRSFSGAVAPLRYHAVCAFSPLSSSVALWAMK